MTELLQILFTEYKEKVKAQFFAPLFFGNCNKRFYIVFLILVIITLETLLKKYYNIMAKIDLKFNELR